MAENEPIATRQQIREAGAKLDLRWFDAQHGSVSGETAQKMHRMEAMIALERALFWGEKDDGPKAA